MKKLKHVMAFIMLLLTVAGCSSDSQEAYTENDAQRLYDGLKGTYKGRMLIDNQPEEVTITLGTEFDLKFLPLMPILKRVFTDEQELSEAMAQVPRIAFNAQTENLAIVSNQMMLSLKPVDLAFDVTVGGRVYSIVAVVSSLVFKPNSSDDLTVNMEVTELYSNGKSYPLTTERIIYLVDSAVKQTDI